MDESCKFQNEVSERLAEQVLHALYELLRGFQAAHDASKGELLRQPLAEHPDEVYRALLTVILRLVFLLYAEERDMLPEDETFLRYYSLAGLYERLREDAALFSDTMDQRYGAWAQLLVLFRMIHDGAEAGAMRLPKRHGVLFDPARFTFLEGRLSGLARDVHGEVPAIPPDEREDIFAMQLIAQRCLYGVDRNPVAVDLAKMSLWLVTLAKDHALTFVDHALRHGDSLVGLSRKQMEAFHWDPDAPRFQSGFETMQVRERVAKVSQLRRRYGDLPYAEKREHYVGQNLLARSLHEGAFNHNPGFKRFIELSGLAFRAHAEFKKADLDSATEAV